MAKPKDQTLSTQLLKWYQLNKRDLPWRKTSDPYKIWVSEIMLQQTTVKAVIDYYTRWLKKFPTVKILAKSDIDEVLKYWQGLGYYNRARNMHKAAKIITSELKGKVPCEPEEIIKLPGMGPYSTAAVLSIAYQKVIPVIDANVRRVFQRILALKKANTDTEKCIHELLSTIISKKNPGDFNQAMMELGALICRSKAPTCNICPINNYCEAYEKGIQEIIPAPKIQKITTIKAVIAVIEQKGKFLIQKRPKGGILADLWEFPGGKIEKTDKNIKMALKREILEELGQDSEINEYLGKVVHYYTQYKIELSVFKASLRGSKVGTLSKGKRCWASLKELQEKYPMPSGSAKIVQTMLNQ